jgi:hypothetical protein
MACALATIVTWPPRASARNTAVSARLRLDGLELLQVMFQGSGGPVIAGLIRSGRIRPGRE